MGKTRINIILCLIALGLLATTNSAVARVDVDQDIIDQLHKNFREISREELAKHIEKTMTRYENTRYARKSLQPLANRIQALPHEFVGDYRVIHVYVQLSDQLSIYEKYEIVDAFCAGYYDYVCYKENRIKEQQIIANLVQRDNACLQCSAISYAAGVNERAARGIGSFPWMDCQYYRWHKDPQDSRRIIDECPGQSVF